MHALVVYESMFGNTQAVAQAVAEGLGDRVTVTTVEVGAAPAALPDDVELLVVGGPTHAFGMSRPGTRRSAADQAERPLVSTRIGLREWLDALRPAAGDVAAATFDTRINKPRLPGSAARAAQKRLRRLGFALAAPAQSFRVADTAGPLLPGEADRALRWGKRLAATVVSPSAP
jgi:hypothetical protein